MLCTLCLPSALHSPRLHSHGKQSEPEDTAVVHQEPALHQAGHDSHSGVLSLDPPLGATPSRRRGYTDGCWHLSDVLHHHNCHQNSVIPFNNKGLQSGEGHAMAAVGSEQRRALVLRWHQEGGVSSAWHSTLHGRRDSLAVSARKRSLPGRKGHSR